MLQFKYEHAITWRDGWRDPVLARLLAALGPLIGGGVAFIIDRAIGVI